MQDACQEKRGGGMKISGIVITLVGLITVAQTH